MTRFTPHRVGLRAALLAVVMLVAPASLAVGATNAQTDYGTGTIFEDCRSDGLHINTLVLMDVSGSLIKTIGPVPASDPDGRRIDAAVNALDRLQLLDEENDYVSLSYEIAVFGRDFQLKMAWQSITDGYGPPERTQIRNDAEVPSGPQSSFTDYQDALTGAASRLQEAPTSGCNILLWFTDGRHTSDRAEVKRFPALLEAICGSEAMHYLSSQVYTQVVVLSPGSDQRSGQQMRDLFDSATCSTPLRGSISESSSLDEAVAALEELIPRTINRESPRSPEEIMPGEDLDGDGLLFPHEEEYEQVKCDLSICGYRFELDADKDVGFRLFVDLSRSVRILRDPHNVKLRMVAPNGETSGWFGLTFENSTGNGSLAWDQVHPFPFWTKSDELTSREIVGHVAAWPPHSISEWAGEWQLQSAPVDATSEIAQQDAARVAAHVVVISPPPAKLEDSSFKLDSSGERPLVEQPLVGRVEHVLKDDDATLRVLIRVLRSDGEPWYDSANGRPLEVVYDSETDRFVGERFAEQILAWDKLEGGGDGRLHNRMLGDGSLDVVLAPLLEYRFPYPPSGGSPQVNWSLPLAPTLSIGEPLRDYVIEEERKRVAALLPAQRQRQFEQMVSDAAERLKALDVDELPSLITATAVPFDDSYTKRLGVPGRGHIEFPFDGDSTIQIEVSASQSTIPSVLIADYETGGVGTVDGLSITEDTTLEAAFPDWQCAIPPSGGEPFRCPRPIYLRVLNHSDDVMADPLIRAVIQPTAEAFKDELALIDNSRCEAESAQAVCNDLAAQIERARGLRAEILLDPDIVLLPVGETVIEKGRKAVPWVLPLLFAAAVGRFITAMTCRRWEPLESSAYIEANLWAPLGAPLLHRSAALALTEKATEATLSSGTLISSSLKPLLMGGERRILFLPSDKSASCHGPTDDHGGVGTNLDNGWVVIMPPTAEPRLVVWDIPDAAQRDQAVAERLASALSEAHQRVSETRPAQRADQQAAEARPAQPARPDEPPRGTTHDTTNPFADDPFG